MQHPASAPSQSNPWPPSPQPQFIHLLDDTDLIFHLARLNTFDDVKLHLLLAEALSLPGASRSPNRLRRPTWRWLTPSRWFRAT